MGFSHMASHRRNECTAIISVWRVVLTLQDETWDYNRQDEIENIKKILRKGCREYDYLLHCIRTNEEFDPESKRVAIRVVDWVNNEVSKEINAHTFNSYMTYLN